MFKSVNPAIRKIMVSAGRRTCWPWIIKGILAFALVFGAALMSNERDVGTTGEQGFERFSPNAVADLEVEYSGRA